MSERWVVGIRGTDVVLGAWFERKEVAEACAARLNAKRGTDMFEVTPL